MKSRCILFLLFALVGLIGCGGVESEENSFNAAPSSDANSSMNGEGNEAEQAGSSETAGTTGEYDAQTTADEGDGTSPDDGQENDAETGFDEPWEPPAFAEYQAPEPVELGEWAITFYNPNTSDAGDSVYVAIESDDFEPPTEKGMHYEQYWKMISPEENGNLDNPGPSALVYAARTFEVDELTFLSVRADRVYTVWVNGNRQPGDLYGTGSHRTPGLLYPGTNTVVLRGFGGAAPPSIGLSTTPMEITFNPSDQTVPDLVAGEDNEQPVGIPVLNHTEQGLSPLVLRVAETEWTEAWEGSFPGIGPQTMTKVPFMLKPKETWPEEGTAITLTLEVAAQGLEYQYTHELVLTTVSGESTGPFRRTFISDTDGSAQFYGETRPTEVEQGESYALALSLHGASVDAKNQAGSYAAKDWIYHIAATNRRPFGFDWQAWGRRDAIEVLEHALEHYPVDREHVHLTGHSMGGHGTWHVGTLFPHLFATIGPSAGWINFETYGGSPAPEGPFGWSQLHFDPRSFLDNLVEKAVYIIHGTADDNVPIWHAETMFELLDGLVPALFFHKEEGAGHWWDSSEAPGVDCVDWAPMFELMKERTVPTLPLEFTYTAPAPWVNSTYSYVTYHAFQSAEGLGGLNSVIQDGQLTLETTNVASMSLDGAALKKAGHSTIVVNGDEVVLEEGPTPWGESLKTPDVHGPFNQIFHRPFCLVYQDEPEYSRYAAYLLSNWAIIGNGSGCSLHYDDLTDQIEAEYNLLHLGPDRGSVTVPAGVEATWGHSGVGIGQQSFSDAALAFVFPQGNKLAGIMVTTPGSEKLLYRVMPFTSRFVIPDYYLWGSGGGLATGFYDAQWTLY